MNNVKVSDITIAFLGTPEFAVPILEKLAQSEYKPSTVFCAPDKPVGRKQILTPPPVKTIAQKYNISVYQPKDKKELTYNFKLKTYQLIITAAYGLILPQEILDLPKYGCLNIHPSLLPKYRGPSPIQNTILNGDAETGVTIMQMADKVDAGSIVAQKKISINNYCHSDPPAGGEESRGSEATRATNIIKPTTPELSKILAEFGANLLLKILPDYLLGKIIPQPQNETQATYTKIIKKEDGQIDWQQSAAAIERQIRAFTPWPSAYATLPLYSLSEGPRSETEVEGSKIKILEADILENNNDKQPGEIFLTSDNQLAVQTGKGVLIVEKLQLEGGKSLSTEEFLRGHLDTVGKKFT